MVVSKDGKRKRKDTAIVDSSPEFSKRTKVQAQRKFAQGQGNPASYSVSSTAVVASSSQVNSHTRENKDSIPELMPHNKPSAEDLVTYICFRGTSGLPPHLDLFKQNNKGDENEKKTEVPTGNELTSKNKTIKGGIKNSGKNKTDECHSGEDKYIAEKINANNEIQEQSESIGYAARKRADQTAEGNRKLKNTDRLARLRDRKPKKIETNRRSPRTRPVLKSGIEGDIDEEPDSIVSQKVSETIQRQKTPLHKEDLLRPAIISLPEKEMQSNVRSKTNSNKKHSLQLAPVDVSVSAAQQLSYNEEHLVNSYSDEQNTSFSKKGRTPTREKELLLIADKADSETNEAPIVLKKSNSRSKNSTKVDKRKFLKQKIKEPLKLSEEICTDITVSKSAKLKRGRKSVENLQSKKVQDTEISEAGINKGVDRKSSRPMRKTKEAATIYMEWIGLKLNLDDDGSSLDSFPELPNAKETQKFENELKWNRLKKQEPVKKKPPKTNSKGENAEKSIVDVQTKIEVKDDFIEKVENVKAASCSSITKEKNYTNSDDEPLATQKIVAQIKIQKKEKRRGLKKRSKTSFKKKRLIVAKTNTPIILKNKETEPTYGEINVSRVGQAPDEQKFEKNFSDSDDEPLATKLVTKPLEAEIKNGPERLQIITEITPVALPKNSSTNDDKTSPPSTRLASSSIQRIEESSPLKRPTSPKSPVNSPSQSVSYAITPVAPVHHKQDQSVALTPIITGNSSSEQFPSLERFPSPKVNPSFLTPKFDRNLERKLPIESITSTLPRSSSASTIMPKLDSSSFKPILPGAGIANVKKYEPDPIFAANLMPSKEESGKIFGIASVSLAQSSGPDNTKCTLGKCGSIHKPVLGPVVPTEVCLGEPLSSKERRKAKVNMTHEQIQKWLIECSSNPDEIQDDLEDDFEEPLKPKIFPPTPPLMRDESGSLVKICKEIRKENSWSGKGPSLKATPVIVKENSREKPSQSSDLVRHASSELQISYKSQKTSENVAKEKLSSDPVKKSENVLHDAAKSPKPSTSSATSSPKRQKNTKSIINSTQKKLTIPKRHTVYSTKPTSHEREKKPHNNFSAFSPENETSVYSFDKEDDVPPPLAKPFRRHSQRESNADEHSSNEKPNKIEKKDPKGTQQNSVSLMLSPEESNKSIKVCLENVEPVAVTKNSNPQADMIAVGEPDSEGHTFYIPLQASGTSGQHCDKSDAIQGVAVKLDREGPEGPNQRVIMHATLVTKSQMGSNSTPIPESMNVHEIVKNLLSSNKDIMTSGTLKSVPIGTVQPRFKSSADAQLATESALIGVNSNSSLLSGSTKSKAALSVVQKKPKDPAPIKIFNNTAFPRVDDPTQMVEAPIFRPTDKEFQDPIEFIERITPIAARFGICKIIPPDSFKPECRVSDDMRFTAYNQYVHKMLHRWGPSAKEFSAIKKYLATQSIAMTHPPWIGGMEVDLPRLYHTVQELGGLKEVIEKKKWARVAEEMCIPKLAQDRVTKLDDIYCKYLLPYDTLSPVERQKLFDEVEADWAKREARARRNADRCVNLENTNHEEEESSENDDESDEEVDGVSMECIVKGRSMPLNAFFRIARNTMALWFKNTEPTVADIEAEFWRHVAVRDSHVCVHSGSIDSSGWGYGFPSPGPKAKGSPCAKHPWNLKVLTNNAGSVLRSLGPVMGVTVPTLHVGMLFSACCWYRDPHGLSWIEYLHTGASKIWYGIPDEQSSKFRTALTALIPTHCQNKTIWLPCDTVMVPPHMLTDRGVSLCRVEQKPGEYVVIFPRAYTSSIATGYVVSESVYFATSSWLDSAKDDFKDIHESCEPAMFSLEQLLFAVANDQRVSLNILSQIVPMLTEVYHKETAARQLLKASGVTQTEKLQTSTTKTKLKFQQLPEEHECDLCRANLYISMIRTTEGNIYCLQHALRNINTSNIQAKQCTLVFSYDIEDIKSLIKKIQDKLGQLQKKGISGAGKKSK